MLEELYNTAQLGNPKQQFPAATDDNSHYENISTSPKSDTGFFWDAAFPKARLLL